MPAASQSSADGRRHREVPVRLLELRSADVNSAMARPCARRRNTHRVAAVDGRLHRGRTVLASGGQHRPTVGVVASDVDADVVWGGVVDRQCRHTSRIVEQEAAAHQCEHRCHAVSLRRWSEGVPGGGSGPSSSGTRKPARQLAVSRLSTSLRLSRPPASAAPVIRRAGDSRAGPRTGREAVLAETTSRAREREAAMRPRARHRGAGVPQPADRSHTRRARTGARTMSPVALSRRGPRSRYGRRLHQRRRRRERR